MFHINENIGLGFRRLSIIDLTDGDQPMSNHDKSIWITFNGEIYNFKELKFKLCKKGYSFKTGSDTEVIIYLYQEYGEDCVNHLNGMFAFAVLDYKKNKIFIARDRIGIKPLFYFKNNKSFIWSSEIKAIKKIMDVKISIDINSLDNFITYGYILQNNSIYSEIKKLSPATTITLELDNFDNLKFNTYWTLNFKPNYLKSLDEWNEEIIYT